MPFQRTNFRKRGAALMIVLIVVAVATVLGFAMISAGTMQAQVAGNLKYTSTAEYLAESGAQLAFYYLQNPSASPVAKPAGYYPGQAGVTFGAAVAGSADVAVTYNSTAKLYTITSVGKATLPSGSTTNKTVTATVAVVAQFKQTAAITTANNLTLTGLLTRINGDLETNGTLNVPLGASVSGSLKYRGTPTILGSAIHASTATVLGSSDTVAVPTLATIKDYTGTYTYQGHTYAAQQLSNGNLANQTLPTAADAITNPAGVYWTNQNVNANGGVTFNGTLIITNGKLTLTGVLPNTFTPKPGFPAVVVQSDITITGLSISTTFNGLVWTGGMLKTGPIASSTTINGAYLSAGSPPIDNNYKGTITINYNAANVAIPDFSTTNATPVGLRIASWALN